MSVLVQRSVLGQSGYPLDQIHIRGIAARGFHGVLQSEREAGQDFSADVTLYLDTRAAARGDDLTETVNYALVAQDVHAILSGDPVNLVETVAERIADAVLARPQVISVDVTVHKPQAPIPLPFDDVVVTIHRDRVNVPVTSAATVDPDDDAAVPGASDRAHHAADESAASAALPASVPPAPVPPVTALPVSLPPSFPASTPPTTSAALPVPAPLARPVVISRTATNELPVVPERVAQAQHDEPEHGPLGSPLHHDPSDHGAPDHSAPDHSTPDHGTPDHGAPDDRPSEHPSASEDLRHVPAVDETAFIPRQAGGPPVVAPVVPPRAPTADEIAILEEQARVSAALRRPEVFGTTRITAGTRPDLVLDQTVVFSPVPASEAGPAHVPPAPPAPEMTESAPAGLPSASETTTLIDPVEMLDRMDTRPAGPVEVVIALGGNLGEPQETLRRAVAELGEVAGTEIVAVGPLARTAAVGGPEQPDFLNTVVLARTSSSARELLHACQRIEQAHGRERIERWGPRTLDVDIIVYDSLIDATDDLELPHPRAHERSFVLAPWAHVDPDAVLPGLGGGPVAALAATAPDREGIRWLALDWLHEAEEAPEPRRAAPPSIAPQPTGPVATHLDDTDRSDRSGPTEASTPYE